MNRITSTDGSAHVPDCEMVTIKKSDYALLASEVERLRGELDLTLKTHVYVSDEWNKAKKRLEEAERERDELRESKDFWYKSWILEENMLKEAEKIMVRQDKQLARYQEALLAAKKAFSRIIREGYRSDIIAMEALRDLINIIDDSEEAIKTVDAEGKEEK